MKGDIILLSKSIFTAETEDVISGYIVIKDRKIAKISKGNDYKEHVSAHTKVIDCGEKTVMPGFIDSHTHYIMGAVSLSEMMCLDIFESKSETECIEMMKKFADAHPDYPKILGMGWYPAFWGDAPLPTKEVVDKAFPDRPCYLICADGHTVLLNTLAMEESGYAADKDLNNCNIGRYENGELDGLFYEDEAVNIETMKIPYMKEETLDGVFRNNMKYLAEKGVTSLTEMSGYPYEDIPEYFYGILKTIESQGAMTCRLHVYPQLYEQDNYEKTYALRDKFESDKFKISGVKGFLDGVAGTYTAYLLEPYADDPSTRGIDVPKASAEELERVVTNANNENLPVRIHCIGDGAVRMALDTFEKVLKKGIKPDEPNTIEHVETIHPDDLPRFKELGVIPSMQPMHLTLDYEEKPVRMGKERARYMWAHRSILDAGAELAFGTDYPVVNIDPFADLYVAVTRVTPDGIDTGTNQEEEKVSLKEAVIAYTRTSAKSIGRESDLGTLTVGKFADVIVASEDIFNLPVEKIKDVSVDTTIMDGKIVYGK